MANLGAIHEDVRFDQAAARRLSAELRAAADLLIGQIGHRNASAQQARHDWRGTYAGRFDQRLRICTADSRRLADALRLAANQVDELARLASEEQDRRERARDWERKQRDQNFFEDMKEFVLGDDDKPPIPPPVEPPIYSKQASFGVTGRG